MDTAIKTYVFENCYQYMYIRQVLRWYNLSL
nr:MAG TPA: hypothetical protein [Caudoviricetes sp.]